MAYGGIFLQRTVYMKVDLQNWWNMKRNFMTDGTLWEILVRTQGRGIFYKRWNYVYLDFVAEVALHPRIEVQHLTGELHRMNYK